MTDTPRQNRQGSGYETREVSGAASGEKRSTESLGVIMDTVQAIGGPATIATGAGIVARQVRDIVVAKIEANAKVEVARIENGYRQEGGVHRADD